MFNIYFLKYKMKNINILALICLCLLITIFFNYIIFFIKLKLTKKS